MAENTENTERDGELLDPDEWVPEKPHDYTEWMDKPVPLYEDTLTPEQREKMIPNPLCGG